MERVLLWLVFVGVVAVLPLLVAVISGFISGHTPTLPPLLAEGDGFLVVVAIAADAIGRAIDRKKAALSAVGCGVVLCVSLICFVNVKIQALDHKTRVDQVITNADGTPSEKRLEMLAASSKDLQTEPSMERKVAYLSGILMTLGFSTSFRVIIETK